MDVGNTNIKLALFDGKEMRSSWRISATIARTADEFGIAFRDIFSQRRKFRESIPASFSSWRIPPHRG